jgi:hypothetical protein
MGIGRGVLRSRPSSQTRVEAMMQSRGHSRINSGKGKTISIVGVSNPFSREVCTSAESRS